MKSNEVFLARSILLNSLDTALPPVLEDPDDTVRKIFSDKDHLSIHQLPASKCIIPLTHEPEECFSLFPSLLKSTFEVEHDPVSGELIGFEETSLDMNCGKSSKNSTSMTRQPGHLSEGIRGKTCNYPFLPGGFEDLDISKMLLEEPPTENLDFKELLIVPPDFTNGVKFQNPNSDWLLANQSTPEIISYSDLLGVNFDLLNKPKEKSENDIAQSPTHYESISKLDQVIKLDHRKEKARDDFINNSVVAIGDEDDSYVCVVDVQQPVTNFKKLLPDPALEYDFELDTFQKQAILNMEKNNHVFVAAHTSAGKTVVAEYAIALALRHMTKAIYTSPIKALSNQKFRDFKKKFVDVGLVTGDVQIQQDANVLVMTTEILRSMLYNGSDVIRDLEWVIFDEVHYINDAERGVVWEEVLILLPAHVKIVMLSATVPNTREFAEWVGRIKRKKVYVLSTTKRPVPLEHYLYTGNNTKTSNELFLLLNEEKEFLNKGYNKAVEAKSKRASKVDQNYGPRRGRNYVNPKLEQQIWSSIILELEKQNKTPAVAFVFSKRRIDENTDNLSTTLDLLTQKQKSAVTIFFNNSIKVLKPLDRELPQVRNLKVLLEKGIGIHHSGVLPILKEIVEMLFQKGLVKVLFATETFAMGVNMPARTVIFDTIQKYENEGMRDLLPGEYIQMAGRAGRRGLDKTGTVILLCKSDVPEMSDLHRMMMGMPVMLTSRFRVTYSMVLNLMRVEQVRIQDMMRRSFGEFDSEKNSDKLVARLKELKQLLEMEDAERDSTFSTISTNLSDLPPYYNICNEYYNLKKNMRALVISHQQGSKYIPLGRVVAIRRVGRATDVPGVVLCQNKDKDKTFKVVVNGDDLSSARVLRSEVAELDADPRSYLGVRLHKSGSSGTPALVEVNFKDFSLVSSKVIKVNAEKIVDDIKRREMPRYRNDPLAQSTVAVSQELSRFVDSVGNNITDLDPLNDLNIHDLDVIDMRSRLKFIEGQVGQFKCTSDPMFEERFKGHRKKRKMEEEVADITYKLSDQSLSYLPEYQQRVQVLRQLGYVDDQDRVKMKGKVACEIKTQEILLTELIFNNLFSDLEPEVIAAILSVVVFEQKRCQEPVLNKKLKDVVSKFEVIAKDLMAVQHQHKLDEDLMDQCNFGLMEVVYEWAKQVPFAKLTELTDVQEGVIVRCIQRLEEVFRDIGKASKIVGDPVLAKKMEEASRLIKRDIVFTASLYVQ